MTENTENNKNISILKILVRGLVCILILSAGVGMMLYFKSLKPKPKQKPPEETIKSLVVEEIKAEPVRIRISGFGTVRPENEVEISSEVTGRLVQTKQELSEGDLVKKGELLVKIDPSDYEIALMEATAEITRLKGEKKLAEQAIADTKDELVSVTKIHELEKKEYDRTQLLFTKQIQPQSQLNKAAQALSSRRKELIAMKSIINKNEIMIETINAQLVKAVAKENQAKLNIKRCTILSPFDGRFKKVYLEGEEHVVAGEKLFELADDRTLEIPVPIDAFDASSALNLMEKNHGYRNWFAKPRNVDVIIEWTENPARCKWSGDIIRIESYNSETRTITIIVKPEKPLNDIKTGFPLVSGMFCKVTFYGRILKDAVKIPWVAIQFDRDVYVVDKDNRLQEKQVEIFCSEGDKAIISSGLKPGDMLVTQRLARGMINGMKVKPVASIHMQKQKIAKTEKKPKTND